MVYLISQAMREREREKRERGSKGRTGKETIYKERGGRRDGRIERVDPGGC